MTFSGLITKISKFIRERKIMTTIGNCPAITLAAGDHYMDSGTAGGTDSRYPRNGL